VGYGPVIDLQAPAVSDPEFFDFNLPASGFAQPLAIVQACHERLRRMVELLIPLREHMREHGADSRAAVTAGTIRQYLVQAWPRHMQDEEVDILPRLQTRLRDRHTVAAQNIQETIATVNEHHRAFDPLFQQVLPLLRAIESGTAQRLEEPAVQAFVDLFRIHMALEEDVLGPAYAKLLTAEDLRQIGSAMAARRGVAWPAPSGTAAPG
jgi:pyridoxamine 5'-phosphate oxidase